MKIAFAPSAWRHWLRLPENVRTRLDAKLSLYAHDPFRYAIKLTDPRIGQYRFRIGDYRIVFDIHGETLLVLAVGHRKDVYK